VLAVPNYALSPLIIDYTALGSAPLSLVIQLNIRKPGSFSLPVAILIDMSMFRLSPSHVHLPSNPARCTVSAKALSPHRVIRCSEETLLKCSIDCSAGHGVLSPCIRRCARQRLDSDIYRAVQGGVAGTIVVLAWHD